MEFNFGNKDFKHSLPQGYQPIISAHSDKVVTNTNGQGGTAGSAPKIANNAPQAIIIEVTYHYHWNNS